MLRRIKKLSPWCSVKECPNLVVRETKEHLCQKHLKQAVLEDHYRRK